MPLPLLPLVFGGGLALALFSASGEAPGPATRAGVQVVPPVQRSALLASLAPRGIAPAGAGAVLATTTPAPSLDASAGRWIAQEVARGRTVLLSSWVMGADGPAELLSVDAAEVPEKAALGSRWSVLAEPGGLAGAPVPGIAPPDQPQPQAPQAPQAAPQAPALEQARQLPQAVRDTIRAALAQGASAQVLFALAREIEGQAPELAEELRREGQNRASSPAPAGTHVVRLDGDTPYRLAAWYTGDGSRWRELLELNGLQAVKDPATGNTYASPWKLGQVIKLPASWPAKAPLPRGDVGGKAPAPAAPDIERIKRDVQQQIQAQQQSAAAQVSGDEIGARPKPKKKKAAGFAGLAGQLRALSAARRDPEARKKILRKTTTIRRIKEQAESGDELAQVVQRALDQLAQQDAEQQAESAPPTPEAPPELPEDADTQSIEIVTETT